MSKPSVLIRKIQPQDNEAIEAVIRNVFPEFELPLTGTAYADAETPKMFESYQGEKEVYFIIEVATKKNLTLMLGNCSQFSLNRTIIM